MDGGVEDDENVFFYKLGIVVFGIERIDDWFWLGINMSYVVF